MKSLAALSLTELEEKEEGVLGKGFSPGFTNNFFDKDQKKMIKGELIMSNAKLRSNVLVL